MKNSWPELAFDQAKDTYETLHLWTQIVGKIKLTRMPWINHSWHVTLVITPTGLTTGNLPANEKHFQINFDFREHQLQILTSLGEEKSFPLAHLSVAAFYKKTMAALRKLGIEIDIHKVPNELEVVVPFDQDEQHATYEPRHAADLHTALLAVNAVLTPFRVDFVGKCSPVHFFWGSFDLAVTRFSGRKAPLHPGGVPHLPDRVAQEAYSHEVSSCGFWPGSGGVPFAAFYSYMYPEPDGYKAAVVEPEAAYYHQTMGEFILPYEAVRQANDPAAMLLDFLQSTYRAGAELADWDRENLEK